MNTTKVWRTCERDRVGAHEPAVIMVTIYPCTKIHLRHGVFLGALGVLLDELSGLTEPKTSDWFEKDCEGSALE